MVSREQEKLERILRAAIVSLIVLVPLNKAASYDGYKLYRLYPDTLEKIGLLKSLNRVTGYDFWQEPRGNSSKLMVAPQQQNEFDKLMSSAQIRTDIILDDVAVQIQRDRRTQGNHRNSFSGDWRSFSFDQYLRYSEILELVKAIAAEKSTAEFLDLGFSSQERKIFGIKLSTSDDNPVILIDGGIHGREWAAPMAVLYILQMLVDNEEALKKLTFYIIPLVNPDGYEHTHEEDRLWRKTMSTQASTECIGVDANRNFDSHWNEFGADPDPCSPVYSGPEAFSEPEARALRDLINTVQPTMYLTFHTYGGLILHPWGFTDDPPSNVKELDYLGKKGAAEVQNLFNTSYIVGSSADVLYLASGGSDDWAMEKANVQFVYCIELEDFGYHFEVPPDKLHEVVQHADTLVQVFINYV